MCHTGINACIGKRHFSAASFTMERDRGTWRENQHALPGCGEDSRCRSRQVARLPQPGELFHPYWAQSLYLRLPRLLISEAGDFGSLQLCLVALLPHLRHPLRISLWATLSTLMNALAGLGLGAMPACSKQWLLSPLLRLYMTCLHPSSSMSTGWVSQSCTAQAKAP